MVDKVYFDYKLERWMPKQFTLPFIFQDYVLLTPKDLLTKDENWINSQDLRADFEGICNSIPNDQLRFEVYNYFKSNLPATKDNKKNTQKEITSAVQKTIQKFPEIIKYYIKQKEEDKDQAKNISKQKVKSTETLFVNEVQKFVEFLQNETNFYDIAPISSFDESMSRILFLKDVIENKDGYRIFYLEGRPIKREEDLQIIYRLTWFASTMDVNRETNNGRGPVDYAISMGAKNKTLGEFKLASNTKLKQNLENQVKVYEQASNTKNSIKVILYFDELEYLKVKNILKDLKLENDTNIVLIDAGKKVSASNVKSV